MERVVASNVRAEFYRVAEEQYIYTETVDVTNEEAVRILSSRAKHFLNEEGEQDSFDLMDWVGLCESIANGEYLYQQTPAQIMVCSLDEKREVHISINRKEGDGIEWTDCVFDIR